MNTFFRVLILLSFLFQHVEAENSDNEIFKIVKVDSDSDGIANYITVEHANGQSTVKIDGGVPSQLEIKGGQENIHLVTRYSKHKDGLKLKNGSATDKKSGSKFSCDSSLGNGVFPIKSQCESLSNLAIEEDSDFGEVIKESQLSSLNFDSTCEKKPELKELITNDLEKITDSENRREFKKCLDSVEYGPSEQWLEMPSSLNKIIFSCSDSDSPVAIFQKTNDLSKVTVSKSCVQKALRQKILESFGINNEKMSDCLAQTCPSVEAAKKCKIFVAAVLDETNGSFARIPIEGTNTTARNQIIEKEYITVPKEIADFPKPTIEDLKVSRSSETSYVRVKDLPENSFVGKMNSFVGGFTEKAFASKTRAPASLGVSTPSNGAAAKLAVPAKVASGKLASVKSTNVKSIESNDSSPFAEYEKAEVFSSNDKSGQKRSKAAGDQKQAAAKDVEKGKSTELGQLSKSQTGNRGSRFPAAVSTTSPIQPFQGQNSKANKASAERLDRDLIDLLDKPERYPDYKKKLRDEEFGEFKSKLKENQIMVIRSGAKIGSPQCVNYYYLDTGKSLIKHKCAKGKL